MKVTALKRAFLLLLALCVLLAATGCSQGPEEMPEHDMPVEDESPAAADPPAADDPSGTNDALEPPADAFAPFEPTQAEIHAEDPVLVTDAFRYTYMYMDTDANGNNVTHEHIYAIPCIVMDSPEIAALNDQIYGTLYNEELIETVENNNANSVSYLPYYQEIDYSWAINGDILSLVIEAPWTGDYMEYYVYNVSISEERLLSNDEVIAAHGMSTEDYLEQARLAFSNVFWELYTMYPAEPSMLSSYESCLQNTMSVENLEVATPYFDMEGKLHAYGRFHFPAGAGQHNKSVCLDEIELCPEWAEHVTA